jgi:putative SOS response-associated peptidase YedK
MLKNIIDIKALGVGQDFFQHLIQIGAVIMCGRFFGFRNVEQLKTYFPIDRAECEVAANYNIAPSQQVLAIVHRNGQNILESLRWGLVPFWAKDVSIGNTLINARSETAAEKPSFREAFKKRRCLIPADGFYEWMRTKGRKQPVFITLPHKNPFAFAGLWEIWQDKANPSESYGSCTILTREASPSIRPVHNRMPLILSPDAYEVWLDPCNQDMSAVGQIIETKALTEVIYQPVSIRVNSVRHNDPTNIRPIQMKIGF